MAVAYGDDLPFDDAVQLLTRALAPELDPDLRAKYGNGRIQARAGLLNMKLTDARGLLLTIAAAWVADVMAHDSTMSTAVVILAAAADRVHILKVEDLQVFDVIRKLSFGKVYRVWVNEEELIASIPSNDPEKAKRTLASMKSRGILEEGPGIWRAIL
jgi:hypothetical protein